MVPKNATSTTKQDHKPASPPHPPPPGGGPKAGGISPRRESNPPEAPPDRREGNPPQGIRSAGGTLSGQPEGGSGPFRSPRKAAGACPPAGPAAQPSIEQPHVEIEAVTQAEEPSPSGPGGVRGALPKRLTPLAVGSRAQPWSFFGYFLSIQKVTPRRAGGQGMYFFSYPPA